MAFFPAQYEYESSPCVRTSSPAVRVGRHPTAIDRWGGRAGTTFAPGPPWPSPAAPIYSCLRGQGSHSALLIPLLQTWPTWVLSLCCAAASQVRCLLLSVQRLLALLVQMAGVGLLSLGLPTGE